jgi:hypothetical protein
MHSLIRAYLCQCLCPKLVELQQPHHARSHCRVSFYAKLRFVSWHDTEIQFIAEIQQFLQVINADAELAVCKLYPARYDRVEDVMTASLSSRTQQVLVVDISKLDTKLVTAKEGTKLFGLVYKNTAGMASSWSQDAGLGCSRCNPTHKLQR